jgi:formate/nitrite transporter
MSNDAPNLDALLPAEMSRKAVAVGVRKAGLDAVTLFVLSVLAGAFIALGANFATVVSAGAGDGLTYGVTRLLAGVVFSLGLILVIVGGAELFTGNNLIVMAWAGGHVTTRQLLRNWIIVYVGNFAGAVGTALLVALSGQLQFGGGAVGAAAMATALAKVRLDFIPAVALGILCNTLVCLAVWLTFSARTTADRILAIVPPIAAFVAGGFEHCVANMYFVPVVLLSAAFGTLPATPPLHADLTIANLLSKNLLPVTIGNLIGGVVLVGAVYWFVYLRRREGS